MVKKCKVLLYNSLVTVVELDEIELQLPSVDKKKDYVNVLIEDGRYSIVSDDYTEEADKNIIGPKKKQDKKTTNDENQIDSSEDQNVEAK